MKFDGYRVQVHKDGDAVVIYSKNGREFTNRFPDVRDAVGTLPATSIIMDGEIVACRPDGGPDFRALHSGNYTQADLCVWAFDLLALNGEDIRSLPLAVRKMKLGTLLRRYDHPALRYSEPFKDAAKLLAQCKLMGLEGIVSKRREAPYRSGKCDWMKVKCAQWREENNDRGDLFRPKRHAADA